MAKARARSALPRNQLTIAQNYDIPFGHGRKYGSSVSRAGGRRRWADGHSAASLPFTAVFRSNRAYRQLWNRNTQPNVGPNNRPMSEAVRSIRPTQNRNQWITGCPNDNCTSGPYLWPASNTFGNYPINTLFGPHSINQDFSIMKTFQITEKVNSDSAWIRPTSSTIPTWVHPTRRHESAGRPDHQYRVWR